MNTSKTFEWDGAKITVRTRTGKDRVYWGMIASKIIPANDDPDYEYWYQVYLTCTALITQSTVEGAPFEIPLPSANAETLRAACNAILEQDYRLLEMWETAITEVDTPPGSSETQPPESVPDAEKKVKA